MRHHLAGRSSMRAAIAPRLTTPLMGLGLLCLLTANAAAATWVWTGLDPSSSSWSRPQNWNQLSAPPNDGTASLAFRDIAASARHDPVADLPWSIAALEISGSSIYAISGAPLSLHDG